MVGIARRKTFRMNAAPNGWASRMRALGPVLVAAQNTRKKGRVAQKARTTNLKAMKKESGMSRKRWPMMAGLLAAGAAVGAAGAMVKRRRKQQRWDEYDAGHAPEPVANAAEPMMGSVDNGPLRETTSIGPAMDKRMGAPAATGSKISSPAGAMTDGAKPESAAQGN